MAIGSADVQVRVTDGGARLSALDYAVKIHASGRVTHEKGEDAAASIVADAELFRAFLTGELVFDDEETDGEGTAETDSDEDREAFEEAIKNLPPLALAALFLKGSASAE